jgi:hypothetical protein
MLWWGWVGLGERKPPYMDTKASSYCITNVLTSKPPAFLSTHTDILAYSAPESGLSDAAVASMGENKR